MRLLKTLDDYNLVTYLPTKIKGLLLQTSTPTPLQLFFLVLHQHIRKGSRESSTRKGPVIRMRTSKKKGRGVEGRKEDKERKGGQETGRKRSLCKIQPRNKNDNLLNKDPTTDTHS